MIWFDIWFGTSHSMIWYSICYRPWYGSYLICYRSCYMIWYFICYRPWYDLIFGLVQAIVWFDIWFATGHVMVRYLIWHRPCYDLIFDFFYNEVRCDLTSYDMFWCKSFLFYFIVFCDVIWHVWQVIIIWPEINVTSFDVKFGITWKLLCFNSWLDFVLCTTWCEMRVGQQSRYRDCPRLGDPGTEVRLLAGGRDFSALQSDQGVRHTRIFSHFDFYLLKSEHFL